jgi:hypothetical protein
MKFLEGLLTGIVYILYYVWWNMDAW